MLDLGGTNAKSQSAKRAMCGSVRVATDNCGTWKGEALLRANNVDNALTLICEAKVCDSELLDVLLEGYAL